MIIFGWNRRTLHTHRNVLLKTCGKCANRSRFDAITRITWFTLFFIPVIPYGFEYFIKCTVCGSVFQVTGSEDIRALKDMVRKSKQEGVQESIPVAQVKRAPAQQTSPANGWQCPKCRAANGGDARFCSCCGYRAG